MTIDERKRTCSYCSTTYKTMKEFRQHWVKCPTRIKYGYVKATNKELMSGPMNKIPNRFMAFMESLTDGSWEYGDGEPMGDDAKMALHYIHSIEEKITALQAQVNELRDVLTTTYDLVAESIDKKQYDYAARAMAAVVSAKNILKSKREPKLP